MIHSDTLRTAAAQCRVDADRYRGNPEFLRRVADIFENTAVSLGTHKVTLGSPNVHSVLAAAAAYIGRKL